LREREDIERLLAAHRALLPRLPDAARRRAGRGYGLLDWARAPVAQWIEQRFPKPRAYGRFRPRAPPFPPTPARLHARGTTRDEPAVCMDALDALAQGHEVQHSTRSHDRPASFSGSISRGLGVRNARSLPLWLPPRSCCRDRKTRIFRYRCFSHGPGRD